MIKRLFDVLQNVKILTKSLGHDITIALMIPGRGILLFYDDGFTIFSESN